MAKSRRKTPITGNTTEPSEKEDKRRWNRRYRRKVKEVLNTTEDEDEIPKLREETNVWEGGKDGKRYIVDHTDRDLRK